MHAHGWVKGYIGNRAVFNMKEKVEAVFDGVTVYDSEIAFRLRGTRGNANVTVMNTVIYDCEIAIRAEDYLANLKVYNTVFGDAIGTYIKFVPGRSEKKTGSWDFRNNVFLKSKPSVAGEANNKVATAGDFVDVSRRDYHLKASSGLIGAGEMIPSVTVDRAGTPRAVPYDIGAYEYAGIKSNANPNEAAKASPDRKMDAGVATLPTDSGRDKEMPVHPPDDQAQTDLALPSPEAVRLRKEIESLESRLSQLREKYTEKWPAIIELKSALDATRTRLEQAEQQTKGTSQIQDSSEPQQLNQTESGRRTSIKPVGQIRKFRSDVNGKLHFYAVCATDTSDTPKPLVVGMSLGKLANISEAVALTEEIVAISIKHNQPCVAMYSTGEGHGSVYQHYDEVDILGMIAHVASDYAIDRDRITVTDASVGGAAPWYLILHYPDFFAGAAAFSGNGASQFDAVSWKPESATFLVENLAHTPVWIVDGGEVAGDAPAKHSRQIVRLMEALGYRYKHTEIPKTDYESRTSEIREQVVLWLLQQRKQRAPDHVPLATDDLRYNRSYWVTIDQLQGERRGVVDARLIGKNDLVTYTENIHTFSLGPINSSDSVYVVIDDQAIGAMNLTRQMTFQRNREGIWVHRR